MSIKIITEPSVYLVSTQTIRGGLQRFLVDHGFEWQQGDTLTPDALPEIAGRLCYESYNTPRPGGNKAYLQHILEVGHGSVLEHAVFGFIFVGVSRSLTHELVRHRIASYSQLSQRYVDATGSSFVLPPAMRKYYDACEKNYEGSRPFWQWRDVCLVALTVYEDLTETLLADAPLELSGTERRKWARQAARSVLPECTATKIYVTMNTRSLRHFLTLRGSRHADAEIRTLAGKVYDVLRFEAPNSFADWETETLPDGTNEVRPCR